MNYVGGSLSAEHVGGCRKVLKRTRVEDIQLSLIDCMQLAMSVLIHMGS